MIDPRLGYVWFAEPNVFVNQAHVVRADEAAANAVHDWVDRALAARGETISRAGGLVVVHDWRALEAYDASARRVFIQRMRARAPGYLKAAYAIVPSTPLFRMAIQAANLAAAIGIGGTIELASDPRAILDRLGIAPPAAGSPFPGED